MALDEYSANADIIGRDDINDLEEILSVSNTDVDEAIHTVEDNADAIFTWDYEKGARPALNKLYEKAKHAQWNGETDLPWETDVDLEKNAELSDAEMRERQEFAFEAAVRMRDRFLQQEVWERMGIKPADILPAVLADQGRGMFQQMLFSKIVPNCKKLGLLDAGATDGKPGWLREKFTELGVIAFEDWADTGEEYSMFQLAEGEVAKTA